MAEQWLSRSAMLLGEEAIERLQRASVAVFGLGGVGSFAAEALARAGVGRLVLVDGDTVADTNRNPAAHRPDLYRRAAQSRGDGQPGAGHPTPPARAEPHVLYYRPGEGEGLIAGCGYVADCVDMVSAKLALAEECAAGGSPSSAPWAAATRGIPPGSGWRIYRRPPSVPSAG